MIVNSDKKELKYIIIEWLLTLLLDALVLILTSKIFKGFYIESFGYAIIACIIIMILNKIVKPILKVLAMPITIMSLGILYPFINVIILKLAGLLMDKHFIIDGWIVPFFISIFISIMTIILDALITKRIVGRK